MPDISISESLYRELINTCVDALPHKAFGMVGGPDIYHPKTLYPCHTNLRSNPEWKAVFESFGEFYKDPDLGFVISPPEVQAVWEAIESRNEKCIGVFHSHRLLKAQPTEIDIYLNSDPGLLCYIVSVSNPAAPEVGVFRLNGTGYQEIPIIRY